ncbi:MAG: phospholipase D-like domain-containing protein [Pseudomonadota bacterium]|nr:phospholipase D-like domain-containing protein [Pseudomonadota bacterium]
MRAFFAGPQAPPGFLRDLLAERIRAVPDGGSIDWVTYYFRDRHLAEDLLTAHRRGVRVTLTIEKNPRNAHANEAVSEMLAGPQGLGAGFRSLSLSLLTSRFRTGWEPHLHEKLYCFSHPQPVAFLGSYNPSGDQPEECPEIIREIGDQNRGYNVLIGVTDPQVVRYLVAHARYLHRTEIRSTQRFSLYNNLEFQTINGRIFFLPRLLPHPVMRFLNALGPDCNLKFVISHLKGPTMARKLVKLARKGHNVEILADSTLRRVPESVERILRDAGISFHRLGSENGLPMHDKFVLVEGIKKRWVIFGSFNWTVRSWWLNQEIGMISSDSGLYKAFYSRWEELSSQSEHGKV